MNQKKIVYDAEAAKTGADGKRIRIVSRHEGMYQNLRQPKHITTIREEQARGLRDALNEVLGDE